MHWHPDRFDIGQANAVLATALAEPVVVTGELAALAEELDRRGVLLLREMLGRPLSHGPIDVTDNEAARLTEPFRVVLDAIGGGICEWWIGRANRGDHTPPIAKLRHLTRALGLVSVRKGRLSPTAAAVRCQAPQDLWRHVVGRLPLGTKDAERQAGWTALAVASNNWPARPGPAGAR